MVGIDFNCDLGEGAGHDAELMPLISSANIACGAHAGDERTMRETIALAMRHGVAIGAHPGFTDREHFGRRELSLPTDEIKALICDQIVRMQRLCAELGATMRHVKLHGALYNMAARDALLAQTVIEAVAQNAPEAALFVLAGSTLERLARERRRSPVIAEVFADRTYQDDGTLTPRSQSNALINDETRAVSQALRFVTAGRVTTVSGSDIPMAAETICLHGDGPHAVAFARRLQHEFRGAGIAVRAPHS